MADKYVSTQGSDTASGDSWAAAYRTVQRGIDGCASTGGGTVNVEQGIYRERVSMKSSVVLQGTGPAPGGAPPPTKPSDVFEEEEIFLCPNRPTLNGGSGGTVVTMDGVQNAAIVNFNVILGMADQAGGRGGGIYIRGENIRVEKNCLLLNRATMEGGGACVDQDSKNVDFIENLFSKNSADSGGGIAILRSRDVRIRQAHRVLDNAADPADEGGGGGVYIEASTGVDIDDAVFRGNESTLDGGGVYITGCSGATPSVTIKAEFSNIAVRRGGGAAVRKQSWVTFSECKFLGNEAPEGAALSIENEGGAQPDQHTPAAHRANKTYVLAEKCTFEKHIAMIGGGAAFITAASLFIARECEFEQNRAQQDGGACHVSLASALDIEGGTFETNFALAGDGGAIFLDNADLTVSDAVKFRRNIAFKGPGGAVRAVTRDVPAAETARLAQWGFVAGGATVDVSKGVFEGSFAAESGGAISAAGAMYALAVKVSDSRVQGSWVRHKGGGGAISLINVNAAISDTDFEKNLVFMPGNDSKGGAIEAIDCPKFSLTGGTVQLNRANFGGGLSLKGCPTAQVAGVTFKNNFITFAGGRGENIYVQSCQGVTSAALNQANPGMVGGTVVVVP